MGLSRSLIILVVFVSTFTLFIAYEVSARDLVATQLPQANDEVKELNGYHGSDGYHGGGGGYHHGGGGGYHHGGGGGHGNYPSNTNEEAVKPSVMPQGYGHDSHGHGHDHGHGGGHGHGH